MPLLRVSKQIRHEAMYTFIKIHQFAIRAGDALKWCDEWLNEIDGHNQVRQLFFPSFDWFSHAKYGPVNGDMELMKKCTGLKGTTLKFHVKKLADRPTYDGELSPIALTQILEAYCLDELFHCLTLRGVTILVQGHSWYEENTIGDAFQTAKELVAYLQDGFDERGLHVEVRFLTTNA